MVLDWVVKLMVEALIFVALQQVQGLNLCQALI